VRFSISDQFSNKLNDKNSCFPIFAEISFLITEYNIGNVPIERLDLSPRIYHALKRSQINLFVDIKEKGTIRQVGEKSYRDILCSIKKFIDFNGLTIDSKKNTPEQSENYKSSDKKNIYQNNAEKSTTGDGFHSSPSQEIGKSNDFCSQKSISEELEWIFLDIPKRAKNIFLSRYGPNPDTFEQISINFNVTRERIRQIDRKTKYRIIHRYNIYPHKNIDTAFDIIKKKGNKISLLEWKTELGVLKILQTENDIFTIITDEETFEIFLAFCRALVSDSETKDYIPENLQEMLIFSAKYGFDASLKEINQISDFKKSKRTINKKIIFTGGINIHEIKQIAHINISIFQNNANKLGYKKIDNDWYILASFSNLRVPIKNAGLKIIKVCEKIEFDEFYRGIRRYISRFFPSLAPQIVFSETIKDLGFNISDGLVLYSKKFEIEISGPEKHFIDLIKEKGKVVSTNEIREAIICHGYSIPAVYGPLLHYSPLLKKVEIPEDRLSYYTILGTKIEWADIQNAIERQLRIDQNDEFHYQFDGNMVYCFILTNYIISSGVIATNKIPLNLDGWKLMYKGEYLGTVHSKGLYTWGFNKLIDKLQMKLGDRIKLIISPSIKGIIADETKY
jgi:hypothetical protein